MRMLELFAGIGGISLAAEWAMIEVVGHVEIDTYCQKILKKHWPNVPLWSDIHEVTGEEVRAKCGAVDIVSGGWPCQPFSIAGKRKGKADDRDLWPEMFRVIEEVRPSWVVGENVTNFVNMELKRTLSHLEGGGYNVQVFVIPACALEATHKRERVFIVAHSAGNRLERELCESGGKKDKPFKAFSPLPLCNDQKQLPKPYVIGGYERFPNRVDRIRALGNAVVPQQIYPIFKAIMEVEA